MASRPVVVLIERDPWLMVVHSDSPTIVLYDDGQAIFRSSHADESGYMAVQLKPEQVKAMTSQIESREFIQLGKSYVTSEWTDQPTNELATWANGTRKQVSVYGNLRTSKEARSKVPSAFLSVFDTLIGFEPPAHSWAPEVVQVLIWPYDYAPGEVHPWPADWPAYEASQPRGGEGLRLLTLPGTELRKLQQFIGALGEKDSVGLGGHKWAISYRIPLPEEQLWQRR